MLPESSYENKNVEEEINAESQGFDNLAISRVQCGNKVVMLNKDTNTVFWLETDQFPVSKDKGVVCFIKDIPFPFRSVAEPHNMSAMNFVKALFIEMMKIMDFTVVFFFIRIALSTKRLDFVLHSFNRISWKTLSPFILKDEYITSFGSEFKLLVHTFLKEIGVSEEECERTSTIFTHIIENDNAYNLRAKDIFSEVDLFNMENHPFSEFLKLTDIISTRENVIGERLKKFMYLLSSLLLIPKYNNAMREAFKAVALPKLQADDNDLYWSSFRTDYNFGGKDKQTRMKYAAERGWKIPDAVK